MCASSRAGAREPFWRDIARIDRLIYEYEKKVQACDHKKRQCYRLLSLWTDYDNWLSETCKRYEWKVRALRRVQTGSMESATRQDEKCSSNINECAPSRTPCAASYHSSYLSKWTSVQSTVGERLRKKRKETKLRGRKLAGEKTRVKIKGQRKPQLKCTRRKDEPSRRGNQKVQEDCEGGNIKGGYSLEGLEKGQEGGEENNGDDAAEHNREEVYENGGELLGEANQTLEETEGGREADSSEKIHPNEQSMAVDRAGAHEALEEGKIYSSQDTEKEPCHMLHNPVGEKNENSLEMVPSDIGGCPHTMGKDEEEENNQYNELEFSEVHVREIILEEGDTQRGGSPEGREDMAEVRKKAEKRKSTRGTEKKTKGKKEGHKKGNTEENRARKREGKKAKGTRLQKEKQTMMEEGEEGEKAPEQNMTKATEKMLDEGKEIKVEEQYDVKMEEEKEENIEHEKEIKLGEEQETTVNEGKDKNIEDEKEQKVEEVEEVKVKEKTEDVIEVEGNAKLDVEKEAMVQERGEMYTEKEKEKKVSEDSTIREVTQQNIEDEGEAKVDAEKDEPREMLNQVEQKKSDSENEPGKTAENEIVHHILSEYSNTIQYTSFLDYIKNKNDPE
ncbi:hypothetical protein AK88_01348 [Plasmodium fragile]|uniref:Uncharacterized protein n=1 Tax=Plasmodium fragile TaxID=5857 RepID=A0A0D9QPM1_PLAFR|nr:uncharacterized protein AK88_01348 [Plasmodium fragile]KJP89055.1 hypothetical protein AK88_01348 [Plasmodium fragile]